MIHIKTEKELEKMRVAGRLTAIARKAAADAVKPGVTTWEIDRIVRKTCLLYTSPSPRDCS